jgi:hypothetical protein
MIPMWKFAPAIACGNAFILKPSERDPSVPMRLGQLMIEAGLPPGILNVVNGDKEAVDTLLNDPRIMAAGFVGSSTIAEYVYSTGYANGKRVQCFGGAKNHMIAMPDADMESARGQQGRETKSRRSKALERRLALKFSAGMWQSNLVSRDTEGNGRRSRPSREGIGFDATRAAPPAMRSPRPPFA